MTRNKIRFPLRTRLVLATCLLAIVFSLGLSYLHFKRLSHAALSHEIAQMGEETHLLLLNYQNRHDQVADDMVMIDSSPSLHGLMHAYVKTASTEFPGQPTTSDPLETARDYFVSLLHSRSEYLQVSLLSTQDNGREVLRVERKGTEIRAVPVDKLLSRDAAATLPDVFGRDWGKRHSAGNYEAELLFLSSAQDPAPGQLPGKRSEAMTVAYPIMHEGHVPIGYILLVVSLKDAVTSTFSTLGPGEVGYLSTPSGLYYRDAKCAACQLPRSQVPAKVSSLFRTAQESSKDSGIIIGADTISYFLRDKSSDEARHKDSVLILQKPRDQIFGGARAIAGESFLIAFAAILLLGLTTARVTHQLMKPLKLLESEVRLARSREEPPKLPVSASDEVGSVARAFQGLIDDYARSENRLSSLIENMGDGVITIDGDGTLTSYNPACERIFKWTEGEVLGQSIELLMPNGMAEMHADSLARFRAWAGQEAPPNNLPLRGRELLGLRKDGTTFPMELTVSELQIGGELTLIGIVRDITERRLAEKAKSEFVATISHELRTPLASIHGALGLIRTEHIANDPVRTRRMAEIATINSKRLMSLIDDILDIEKLERSELSMSREVTKLRPVVMDAVSSFQFYGKEAGVAMEFVDTGADANVLIDPERIVQVVGNLLSNAVKFSEAGSCVRVWMQNLDGRWIRVLVEDEGCGIPQSAWATIFEKFKQVDSSDIRRFGGVGLGLNIARTIIERHGGKIDVESEVGEGATFHFDLPIERACMSHDGEEVGQDSA